MNTIPKLKPHIMPNKNMNYIRKLGCVAYYDLSQPGNKVLNQSKYPYCTGTSSNTTQSPKGKVFNGTSGYISIENNPAIDITSRGITINAILKKTGTGSNYVLSRNTDAANNNQYGLIIQGTNPNFHVDFYLEGISRVTTNIAGGLFDDTKFNMITAIWDGNTASLYINGKFISSGSYSGTLTSRANTNIGARGNTSGTRSAFFGGIISIVSIFNRGLTQSEVTNLLNIESSKIY